jgi:hypothetical protein
MIIIVGCQFSAKIWRLKKIIIYFWQKLPVFGVKSPQMCAIFGAKIKKNITLNP